MDTQDVNGSDWFDYQPERCGGTTDKGPRRAENQDTFWIPDQNTPTDLGALYLVADGVGGQQDGAVASKLAAQTVQQVFYDLRRQGRLVPSVLKDALEKANQVIQEEAQKRQIRKMGSTFVAAVQDGDKLMIAHVGDARAYLLRQGELRQLTRDDTWVQRQVDAGLLTEEEAANHEFRNVVTQVLGNKPEITINLSQSHMLQPGDAVLLCSDGLYDVLPDSRIVSLIAENAPQQASKLLVEAAIEAEATDNITAVVMRTGGFVPMADEPTLVPLPAAVVSEATLTAAPAAVESAPTIMTPAPPLAPPPAKEKGGISKWLIILAIIAILLIAGALGAFWLRNRNVVEDSQDAAATALPAIIEEPTAASTDTLDSLVPTSTIELPVATEAPTETPTIAVPDTPTPRSTAVNETALEQRGCVIDRDVLFVWARVDNGCGPTPLFLRIGDEVQILDDPSIVPGLDCGPGKSFIRIQSVSNPLTVGWVHEEIIDRIGPGDSCSQ